jgi:hypothetical protein
MHRSRRAAPLLSLVFVLTGCDALAGMFADDEQTRATPCRQEFNAVRCLAMTDSAAQRLHATREDVMSLEIMPEPTLVVIDGVAHIPTRGAAAPIELRVTLADGSTRMTSMCGDIPSGPACMDEPKLETGSFMTGGYRDVPQGSSPVPSAAPDAVLAATTLRIDRLDIPIDHTGPYLVTLGEALLPNGLLSTVYFELVDVWPADVTIIEGGVHLEVRSIEDGRRIWNIYEHGWREGTERVEAILVFDVFRFEPGATLSVRDVVVR